MESLPKRVFELIPAPEPKSPSNGFLVNVAYPYTSPGSKQRVIQAIDENTISSSSSVVTEFETKLKEFYSVPFAKACSSGVSALVLALKLASIGEGDDVLIPSFTMAAVVNSVIMVGANPIFIDCENNEYNPSPSLYEEKCTCTTKAIIVGHTYGVPADCLSLSQLCKSKGIIFIEDIAEAIGADYNGKLVGTFGDFACSSLYANKLITAGDGGFVISRHENLEDRANTYVNHGFIKDYRYLHFELSGNYKMSGLQAAFVAPAVQDIPLIIKDRQRIAASYRECLSDASELTLLPKNHFGKDAPWMFGVVAKSKEERTFIRKELAKERIETRDFFFPLHLQPMIVERFGIPDEAFQNSVLLGTCGLCLPTYYDLKQEDIEFVCKCLKRAITKT